MATFNTTDQSITIPNHEIVAFMGVMGFVTGAIDEDYLASIPGFARPFMESVRDSAGEFASVIPRD